MDFFRNFINQDNFGQIAEKLGSISETEANNNTLSALVEAWRSIIGSLTSLGLNLASKLGLGDFFANRDISDTLSFAFWLYEGAQRIFTVLNKILLYILNILGNIISYLEDLIR